MTFFFSISPFLNGNVPIILCMFHHYTVGAENLFFHFHRFTDEEKLCLRMDHTQSLTHTPSLDDLNNEIWDFRVDGI